MQRELERARRIVEDSRHDFEMLATAFIESEVMTGVEIGKLLMLTERD